MVHVCNRPRLLRPPVLGRRACCYLPSKRPPQSSVAMPKATKSRGAPQHPADMHTTTGPASLKLLSCRRRHRTAPSKRWADNTFVPSYCESDDAIAIRYTTSKLGVVRRWQQERRMAHTYALPMEWQRLALSPMSTHEGGRLYITHYQ